MRPARTIIPFEQAHLALLALRPEQAGEAEQFGMEPGQLAAYGPSFTAAELDGEGRVCKVLACAGLAEKTPPSHASGGYATAWGSFAADLRPAEWSFVTAAIKGVLAGCGHGRVDMVVRTGFEAAHRYAAALGFSIDATIYSRSCAAKEND